MRMISPRVIRGNRGDLLSRWGLLQALRPHAHGPFHVLAHAPAHLPPGDFTFVTYGPVYNAIPTAKGLRALSRSDVVVWTGGLDLQDDSSLIKLLHTFFVFASYRLLGLRILLMMQGAGPLTTRAGRLLSRLVLALVSLALARDRGTLALLQGLGCGGKTRLSADGIFLDGFPGRPPHAAEIAKIDALTQRPAATPLIFVNVRLWFHFANGLLPYQLAKERYRRRAEAGMSRFIARVAETIADLRRTRDARVLLVSMYEPGIEPWEDDLAHLERLKADYFSDDASVSVVSDPLSLPGFFTLLGRGDLMIGARLHACLTALRAGVPAVHIAYTLKGRDIYADLGMSDMAIPLDELLDDGGALTPTAQAVLDNPRGARARVDASVAQASALNRDALAWLFEKLGAMSGREPRRDR